MGSLSFLNNDQSLKQKTSALWVSIVLRLSFELEVENWRLTRRNILQQHFLTLSARSLKLVKRFSATKHLSVFCLMCSCFLDAVQTLLGSKQPTQTHSFSSSPPFSQGKFTRGAAKKPPNLESHLNAKRCTTLVEGLDKFCRQNFEQKRRFLERAFCRQNKAFSNKI